MGQKNDPCRFKLKNFSEYKLFLREDRPQSPRSLSNRGLASSDTISTSSSPAAESGQPSADIQHSSSSASGQDCPQSLRPTGNLGSASSNSNSDTPSPTVQSDQSSTEIQQSSSSASHDPMIMSDSKLDYDLCLFLYVHIIVVAGSQARIMSIKFFSHTKFV